MKNQKLTQSRLKYLLRYDPETGVFTWVRVTSNRVSVGLRAGRDNGNGYRRINIDGRSYYEHVLAWLYTHGEYPSVEIDHKDGDGYNNRISNLREATHLENGQNQSLRSTNTTGAHGVSFSKLHKKYEAYIWFKGKKRHLGLFKSKKSAKIAYLEAKENTHLFQPIPRDVSYV